MKLSRINEGVERSSCIPIRTNRRFEYAGGFIKTGCLNVNPFVIYVTSCHVKVTNSEVVVEDHAGVTLLRS